MANTSSNRAIKIEDLEEKFGKGIAESNLMIIEDDFDTKKCTIRELKQSFNGDELPSSRYYFYSTQYINGLLDRINIAISNRAPKSVIEDLQEQIKAIDAGEITPDFALYVAEKMKQESDLSDAYYVKKAHKTISGTKINIDGHVGLVTVTPKQETSFVSNAPGKILYYSKNRLSMSHVSVKSSHAIYTGYKTDNMHIPCDAGKYYLYIESVDFNNIENISDVKISIDIAYSAGNIERVTDNFDYAKTLEFTATGTCRRITITVSDIGDNENASVNFNNMMLTQYKLSQYVPYHCGWEDEKDSSGTYEIYNNDYIFEFNDPNKSLVIGYYDHTVTVDTLLEKIDGLYDILNDKIDRCGLMTDYGTYHPFDSYKLISSEETGEIADAGIEYERNGFTTKKIKIGYKESEYFQIKQILTDLPSSIESVSLCFYIDKLTIEKFAVDSGISMILCSDDPEYNNINRYMTTIYRSEMVHGWNVIKRPISEFEAILNPDIYSIKSITIALPSDTNLNGKEIYINSVCFNQKMKPTVILSFDGTYDDKTSCSRTDDYPYLIGDGTEENPPIPATVLLNASREIAPEEFNELIRLKNEYGWDIGAYGNICDIQYPKENLQSDMNEDRRSQYIGLLKNKQYLQENVIYDPISYSAPYGDLRPMTVPFLKELGYKIARTEADSYISIFTKKDFAIPMTLISNKIFDEYNKDKIGVDKKKDVSAITNMIDYAITNNVAVSLFLRQISEDGTERLARRANFESIINYIRERVKTGQLQVLTMADFYRKCVE